MVNPVAAALPASALSTNALRVTCPFCSHVATVCAKKLQTSGSESVPSGGFIQTRSTVVRCCKCGEMIPVNLRVFVPEVKIKLVAAKENSMTFNKPKLRAPSDKP